MKITKITLEQKLHIHAYLETWIESFIDAKEAQYLLDLVTRDWKMQGAMRSPYQVRNEMEHQKRLWKKAIKNNDIRQASRYETRLHFASWVLGDSENF